MDNKKKLDVAIIGAGFGGISAAKILANISDINVHIIDRRNHHLFQPLLYQVAMAGLNPSDIAIPIRKLFYRCSNVRVILSEVDGIDVENSKVRYDGNWMQFDYVIIACGAKHFYFGNNEWEKLAPGLKNIEQAIEIRRRVLTAFELAEKETDMQLQQSYLTFAVIGGGPTGVELAGAIAEMAKNTLMSDYRVADLKLTKVYLIEAGPQILPSFPIALSLQAEKDLADLGVQVMKNTRACALTTHGLRAGKEWINCKTMIWAAGVKPASVAENTNSNKDDLGRLIVRRDLSLPSNGNIFAIGDVSGFVSGNGNSLPGIAPVAIQQGHFVGNLILNDLKCLSRKEFVYCDKGIMATIGRSRAIVSTGKIQLTGLIAWLVWVFVHIIYLMRFRNKVFIFFHWVWGYFSFGHGARLITHRTWRFYSGEKLSYRDESNRSTND